MRVVRSIEILEERLGWQLSFILLREERIVLTQVVTCYTWQPS